MKRNKEWIEGLRAFLKKGIFGQDKAIDALCEAMETGMPGVILSGAPGMGKTLILQKVLRFVHEQEGIGESVPMITCVVPAAIERQLSDRGKMAKALERDQAAVIGFDGMGLVKEPVREGLLALLAKDGYMTGNGIVLPTKDAFFIFTTTLSQEELVTDLEPFVADAVKNAWVELEPITEEKGACFVECLMKEMARPIRMVSDACIVWKEEAAVSVYRKIGENPNYLRLKKQVNTMMEHLLTLVFDCDYKQYDREIICYGYVGEEGEEKTLQALINATKKEEK